MTATDADVMTAFDSILAAGKRGVDPARVNAEAVIVLLRKGWVMRRAGRIEATISGRVEHDARLRDAGQFRAVPPTVAGGGMFRG
jgi:hypothetical protein